MIFGVNGQQRSRRVTMPWTGHARLQQSGRILRSPFRCSSLHSRLSAHNLCGMAVTLQLLCTVVILLVQCIRPIVVPPDEYSVQVYLDMAARQQDFVLDAFQMGYAGVNPSIARDPSDEHRTVAVWRKGRERNSKVGYVWFDKDWNPLKDVGTIGMLAALPLVCLFVLSTCITL
jgi:hypothetical protein